MTPSPSEHAAQLIADLWTIYSIEQIGSRYLRPLDRARFMAVAENAIRPHAPAIFGGGQAARHAVYMFFYDLEEVIMDMPLTWQRPFRDAYNNGRIDRVALGSAVRNVYRHNSPEPRYAGEGMSETLDNLRCASPAGLMLPQEMEIWRTLPDQVTIYRGALTDTLAEAAQGISWSLSRAYASAHLYRRTLPRYAATDIRAVLGIGAPARQLISAVVPRSLILAAMCTEDQEVFIDYKELDPAVLVSLPTTDLLHQGTLGKVQQISMRLHTA